MIHVWCLTGILTAEHCSTSAVASSMVAQCWGLQ